MAHGQGGDNRRYETRDANYWRIMITAAALLGIMVAGSTLAWFVYDWFRSPADRPGAVTETFTTPERTGLPPAPNLEANPAGSLAALRASEDSVLTTYGWADSAKGLARVPVARAMELYLRQEGADR